MSSNDRLARLAGLLYLIMILTTGFSYGFGRFLVQGDAAAILANVQKSRTVFELAIVAGMVGFVAFLVLGLVLYRLFSTVGRGAASLMMAFIAVSIPLSLAALTRQVNVLSLLDQRLPALGGDQLQMQVVLALHSSTNLILVSAVFWGLWLIPLGWLVLRSGFMPRVLGVLLIPGSVWYVLSFPGTVLNSGYENTMFARAVGIVSGIPSVAGELGTCLWLLIMGSRERKAASSVG
jgi:hypothetical protein